MATRARAGLGLALILGLGLGAWGPPPAPEDPEIAPDWYPLACTIMAGQIDDRIDWLRARGRLDLLDTAQFEAAARRAAGGCPMAARASLRLLISLGQALDGWPGADGHTSNGGGADVLSSRDPGVEPGSGVAELRR